MKNYILLYKLKKNLVFLKILLGKKQVIVW